jgi:hypothetical protein
MSMLCVRHAPESIIMFISIDSNAQIPPHLAQACTFCHAAALHTPALRHPFCQQSQYCPL